MKKLSTKNKRMIMLASIAILAILLIAAAIGIAKSIQRCKTELSIAAYSLETGVTEQLRIAQLSDLHGCSFGENNADLVSMVKAQKPDLILMTGDMVDKEDEDASVVCVLIEQLVSVAPIYYCHGNHEYAWMSQTGENLLKALSDAGANVLDIAYTDVEIKGQSLRLGGYHGYYRYPGMFPISEEQRNKEWNFCENFENTDRYKILLCHIPTVWLDWGGRGQYPVDLVLTGHYHGGQVRLPFVGGVIAPYVGWFPEYTEGMYVGEQATVILSTGLGSSPGIPRVNNLPQVVVVDLIPEE